jgi:hypothetical protein
MYLDGTLREAMAMPGGQIKKLDDVMGGLYLGIALAGVEALVAMAIVIVLV